MDNWTDEDWAKWRESMQEGTWLLERGEKVVGAQTPTPEQIFQRKAAWDAVMEDMRRGRHAGLMHNG